MKVIVRCPHCSEPFTADIEVVKEDIPSGRVLNVPTPQDIVDLRALRLNREEASNT